MCIHIRIIRTIKFILIKFKSLLSILFKAMMFYFLSYACVIVSRQNKTDLKSLFVNSPDHGEKLHTYVWANEQCIHFLRDIFLQYLQLIEMSC